jgi:hypothetical protein
MIILNRWNLFALDGLSDQLFDELKALYRRRQEEGLKVGKAAPEEIVVHTNGGYTSQNTIRTRPK